MEDRSSPRKTLYSILSLEREKGYTDKSVAGGLDRFLERWESELRADLGPFVSYSVLSPTEREKWATRVTTELKIVLKRKSTGELYAPNTQTTRKLKRQSNKGRTTKLSLYDPITSLYRFPGNLVSKFKALGIETIRDLIYYVPNRHNNFTKIRKIAELQFSEEQSVVAKVIKINESRQGPGRRSSEAVLEDESGTVKVIWFNNPYLARSMKPGTPMVVSGKVNVFRGQLVFESPEYEVLPEDEDLVHTGRHVPVYPSVDGLGQRTIRRFIKQALDIGIPQLSEFLPEDTIERANLVGVRTALKQIHYPDFQESYEIARRRLAFDELFLLQLGVLRRKHSWRSKNRGISLKCDLSILTEFLNNLPFELTDAQQRVLKDILGDVSQTTPMSRLIQGDVGSGKTVVAVAAMLVAAFNGYQSVLMAPTEVLAEQHFISISYLLNATHAEKDGSVVHFTTGKYPNLLRMGLLVGSLNKKTKENIQTSIGKGELDLVIGTQALIQDQLRIPKLALAVIDEQHRFGVMQRSSFKGNGGRPHVLAMSATPIPRSLALTLYGDLDLSVVDEKPHGRLPIQTKRVDHEHRKAAYNFVKKQVNMGHQAFVVCPLIDKSEKLQTQAAVEEHHRLATTEFNNLHVGLLHGRMSLSRKEEIMDAFRSGKIDVLVSTPVVEVGIDVSNATVMVIDGAERFGLAQLHQLRGRVGRGEDQSYCLLLAESPGMDARKRLEIVQKIDDGFELAERDLEMRGPGDYLGTRQTGFLELKIASILDHKIFNEARIEALNTLKNDEKLSNIDNRQLLEEVRRANPVIEGNLN